MHIGIRINQDKEMDNIVKEKEKREREADRWRKRKTGKNGY